ncbi:hypothetical protein AMBAS45_07555 [Alteromonas macleodii str. 'Balearic Sea AD45']|nr:hypothetical protein AMBAS45_07555 [Alteromonas macleodii str. 'Balearic Sea AD45']HCG88110.1 hypothetical protein [Alteromonas macleodii]
MIELFLQTATLSVVTVFTLYSSTRATRLPQVHSSMATFESLQIKHFSLHTHVEEKDCQLVVPDTLVEQSVINAFAVNG